MKVTTVQTNLFWEDKKANLKMFDNLLNFDYQTDIVILPEMFTTGFSMNPQQLAETMQGETMIWLHQKAQQFDAAFVGSFIAEENGLFFNRLVFMRPDGTFEQYDKRHLFALANENQFYTAGATRTTIDWRGWRICPLICYDLRFPVWSRNYTSSPYDLLLYVANWPQRRVKAWESLLVARAIENQCFVIGVNRVGDDGNNIPHTGSTSVIDFSGEILYNLKSTEGVETTLLSKENLETFRKNLPFLADQDNFLIT